MTTGKVSLGQIQTFLILPRTVLVFPGNACQPTGGSQRLVIRDKDVGMG